SASSLPTVRASAWLGVHRTRPLASLRSCPRPRKPRGIVRSLQSARVSVSVSSIRLHGSQGKLCETKSTHPAERHQIFLLFCDVFALRSYTLPNTRSGRARTAP